MESPQKNEAGVQGKLKRPGHSQGRTKLKLWLLPGAVLLLIALGWYLVIKQRQTLIQTTLSTYQQTELELVRSVARTIKNYVEIQMGTLGRSEVKAIEQEIFKLFVEPVRLLENGDAWIYAPEHIVFDLSSDFPDKYRGKNMAEIFALQAQKGATHYEAMVESVMNAREGVGWYIWLPQKGQEVAAWTPVVVGDYTWVIGLSTPLPEILESNGDASQIRASLIIMSLATLVALGLLMIWGQAALKQERLLEAEREQRLLAETLMAARKQTEIELVQRNAELLALLYAGATISTSLDLQVVLETITREMASLLGAERCLIFQWTEAEDKLFMITGFGLEPQSKPEAYNLADIPLARQVLAERYAQQLRISQPEIPETAQTYMARLGAKTLLLLPMEFQNRLIGLIQALDNRTERTFTYVEIALAQLLANQAASALENAKLYKLAQESEANLIENRRLAIEQERQRLARELHDSVTQSLYSIGMAAQAALRLLNQGQESRLPDPITYIHQLSQTALAEMRERVYDLHPTVLRERDLVETLKGYCELLSEKYGLVIEFTASKDLEFTIYQRENLYYIAREALWNVVKHAGPTQVKVQLAKRKNQIVLSIADRGPGFALPASQETELMGLRTMEERAKLLRGSFEIRSAAETGTQIVVQIPI